MTTVVWIAEPLAGVLCDALEAAGPDGRYRPTVVASAKEFIEATRDPRTVSFVDGNALVVISAINHVPVAGPVIAICEAALSTAVDWLASHRFLSHVLGARMLSHPMVVEHLRNVLSILTTDRPKLLDWLGPPMVGRRVRLTHASRRVERLERMTEFFAANGVGERTIVQLRDVGEELLTNAFYDGPVAAGAVKRAISRTQDVVLPDDSACDLVYGCRDDLALIRVQDPFGALSRARLVEVLSRCARNDMKVRVDETMGGAGLGLWRIFALASFVALSVSGNRSTEVLVGIAKRGTSGPRPYGIHLLFKEGDRKARRWEVPDADSNDPSIDHSVAILDD